mmetsp:Transcript_109476/g.342528  ORF Transcript_109476/g.342528 Transcript_109476/m.342528 type:complete len:207 (-) Transcript_109476:81-701(-)
MVVAVPGAGSGTRTRRLVRKRCSSALAWGRACTRAPGPPPSGPGSPLGAHYPPACGRVLAAGRLRKDVPALGGPEGSAESRPRGPLPRGLAKAAHRPRCRAKGAACPGLAEGPAGLRGLAEVARRQRRAKGAAEEPSGSLAEGLGSALLLAEGATGRALTAKGRAGLQSESAAADGALAQGPGAAALKLPEKTTPRGLAEWRAALW